MTTSCTTRTSSSWWAAASIGGGLSNRVGLFDETMRLSEDTDWFFRYREAGLDYRLIPEVTILYRRHEASMTHGLDAAGKGYLMAIKKSLDRRRRMPP